MSYQEKYQKAKKEGNYSSLSIAIHKWNREGDTIVGKIVGIGEFDKSRFANNCNKYVMDTDDGLISFVLGSNVDNQLEGKDLLDKVICVTFHGQTLLDDGRKCNSFSVELLQDD